jgi:hypothetical protein
MDGARTATSPQIWVPDLRDNLIVAKVGIVRSATVFSCTDHTLKAAGAVVAANPGGLNRSMQHHLI